MTEQEQLKPLEQKSEPPFLDLAVFKDKVDLEKISEGFLIVRRNFQLLPERYFDIGFAAQMQYHRSDDFYSIPLLQTNLKYSDPECLDFIVAACAKLQAGLQNEGIVIANQGVARFLVNFYDDETGKRGYYLYESEAGKVKRHPEYWIISDSEEFAYRTRNLQVLEDLIKTEQYFQGMNQ